MKKMIGSGSSKDQRTNAQILNNEEHNMAITEDYIITNEDVVTVNTLIQVKIEQKS